MTTIKMLLATGLATCCASAATAQTAPANDAYLYSTTVFEKIKPQLELSATTGTVTGTYTATQGYPELEAIMRTGTYGTTSGTIEGQFSGNVLTGYWYEQPTYPDLQGACDTERNGTRIFGRFTLTFSADRKSFRGISASCDTAPDPSDHAYNTWTGSLIRRVASTTNTTPPAGGAQPQPTGPSAMGNSYSTIDWGDLTVTGWAPTNFTASYTHDDGRIVATRAGNRIDGYWRQTTSAQPCSTPRDGSVHYGRMTFTFNAALDAFEGVWGYCDETPYAIWNGNLTRRGTPVTGAVQRDPGTVPPRPVASAPPAAPARVPGAVQRAADTAGSSAERRVNEEIDRRIDRAIGRIFRPR